MNANEVKRKLILAYKQNATKYNEIEWLQAILFFCLFAQNQINHCNVYYTFFVDWLVFND